MQPIQIQPVRLASWGGGGWSPAPRRQMPLLAQTAVTPTPPALVPSVPEAPKPPVIDSAVVRTLVDGLGVISLGIMANGARSTRRYGLSNFMYVLAGGLFIMGAINFSQIRTR